MKNRDYNRYLLSFIDLTSLNNDDTPADIEILCQKALNPIGRVKAICIYPQFISHARSILQGSTIKIATVCNFPEGNKSLPAALTEVDNALNFGADEIDLVMPYREFLAGNPETTTTLIKQAKQLCHSKTLKIILETGAYEHSQLITDASITAIHAGADFIKTSTGKITQGATLAAAHFRIGASGLVDAILQNHGTKW
jgi:deoxyribose-phosphate aldolase